MSVRYVFRETVVNLRRNLVMTSAAVLTVAVSLSLVGAALLFRQGVSNATIQWRGGVEVSIFLQPETASDQQEAIGAELRAMPEVKKVTYLDQEESYKEFEKMFAGSPEMVEAVTPKDIPPSFRVVPTKAELAGKVGERFEERQGVDEVSYAEETVKALLEVTRVLQFGVVAIAGVLLLSATLLILNTIRMAIFARRREVRVMKLVGATNWFVRVPFVLEGLAQGLAGGVLAFSVVVLGRGAVEAWLQGSRLADLVDRVTDQLWVSTPQMVLTGMFVLLVGGIVGAVGSAVAVNRFLDV